MSVLRLAIPSPLRRHFDYLPPADMGEDQLQGLKPGQRLRVPFGPREVTGYLLGVHTDSDSPPAALRPAIELLDEAPLLAPPLLALCQWAAGYYHHPLGEVLGAAFPKQLRKGRRREEPGLPAWRLSTRGRGLPEGALARSPRQAQALGLLQARESVAAKELADEGIAAGIMRALQEKGLVEKCLIPEHPQAPPAIAPGLDLNREQAGVLEDMLDAGEGFSCHLLEGVTGSGKTEVYLQLIAHTLRQGKQALVLIPEIGLTPQTLSRFEQRFDTGIAVLHSGLGDAQRYRAWDAARTGRARIVIGTRSAVFTPLRQPGLIIVDEEHDASYKQQDGFRYSARDVAVKRGQLEGCPVLLGSATPSLESLHNALGGKYGHHRLQQRAGGSALPRVKVIDIRRPPLQAGLSDELIDAVEQTLQAGSQSLLFLNRRGYAPTLQCHDCGWIGECRHCDARLTVHRRQRRLRCHHCGASQPLPDRCPQCHSGALLAAGLGTEQTDGFLRGRFAQWPIHRVDSDSMQGREAMHNLVTEINRGEPCILLGTQMLTKGHHFPGVSLVGVIDTDAMLFSADFRGEERMAQLLTQVSGRAGRAKAPGRVLLQSHYPDHPALLAMLNNPFAEYARELLNRRRQNGLPPDGKLVIVRTDCADAASGEQFLQALRTATEQALPTGARLIGPLPSPMQRRAGKFRSQLVLTAADRGAAQRAAGQLVACAETLRARSDLKWTIDIDPMDVF